MQFIGRERELRRLRKEFGTPNPSLIIAYGRRRIGKTRLLREAAADLPAIYFQAARVSDLLNLEQFKAAISELTGPSPVLDGLGTWESIFHFLADLAHKQHPGLVIVIDEFPYITNKDQALPSIIQRFWDSGAPGAGNLKLVLCGSAIAQMQELLAERCPLHGRQTMSLEVKQLPLRDVAVFFPEYDPDDVVSTFCVFGGVPHYLTLCDPTVPLRDNIINLLLTETGPLFEEPETVLQNELQDPRTYAGIIAAISEGKSTSGDIASRLKVETKDISAYLATLQKLDLVLVERSLDADDRSRNLRYALKDKLMAFWHYYVRPNVSAIQSGFGEEVYDRIVARTMSEFMGGSFEAVCREHAALHAAERLGSPAQKVGHIWGHPDMDIDVAGRLLDGSYFYGECKWKSGPLGMDVLNLLRERADRVSYGAKSSGKRFLLYSRNGYKANVLAAAGVDASVQPVDLEELVWAPTIPDLVEDLAPLQLPDPFAKIGR